jgi:predicted ATPase
MLVLHGFHWADATSARLLLHLGRHLTRSRILIVVTYRPVEVGAGWAGEGSPLSQVVGELKRRFGDMEIDLDGATRHEGRSFVDALLDSEPNKLDDEFRQALWEVTDGHALFTVELVREMKDCGDLQLDEEGRWVAGPHLNWGRLPARVEAILEMRLARLAPDLKQALRVASVEGAQFTAEVVARVQGIEERRLIRMLSGQGVRQHRLLVRPSLFRQGDRFLCRYRFRHHLFQQYLYQTMDEVERAVLHREIGQAQAALAGKHEGLPAAPRETSPRRPVVAAKTTAGHRPASE